MNDMNKVIFLTGATGLVGGNLIPRILKNDTTTRLILLIRGNSDGEAEKRLEDTLGILSPEINFHQMKERIKVLRGDVTLSGLGLSRSTYSRLTNQVTHIIHSAATVQFHLPLECARLVNFEGTRNVMTLAKNAQEKGKLQRVAYISTAYVCGNRGGKISEDDLELGQRFANTYEQTKFESENLVRGLLKDLPLTIFRPSIIVGDSKTGRTTAFNVLYLPLKLIHRRVVKTLPGFRKTPLDVVPIDFVSDAINHIFLKNKQAKGKTYHLTAGEKKSTTAGEVVDLAVEYFNQTKKGPAIPPVRFVPLELYRKVSRSLDNNEKKVWEAMEIYEPYLCGERVFDNSNACSALQGTDIIPPKFKTYSQIILRYCIQTDWGKRMNLAKNTK